MRGNVPAALDKTGRKPDIAADKKHQRIRELAKLPRGEAWPWGLCAFEDAIRAQRKAHKSYREIAAWLDTQGLHVSASSVHDFVKARAQRKRPLYALAERENTKARELKEAMDAKEQARSDQTKEGKNPRPGGAATDAERLKDVFRQRQSD